VPGQSSFPVSLFIQKMVSRREHISPDELAAFDLTDPLLTVRISNQTRTWFNGPWRLGNGPDQRGFGFRRRRG
jgi:hypothetical protein